ncbi:hypothetical protein [Ruegeria arenilitoris]|uniref:hypothetical protein n=1 Tax=Ruegeria arenilitoris TaxID=1173585 RepID=UPI00147C645F|nr:hypothetical protein [Ruegeria arenilitoris]
MTRLLFPALFLSGPAMAHSGPSFHAHSTDYVVLGTGLVFAALVAITLLSKLPK